MIIDVIVKEAAGGMIEAFKNWLWIQNTELLVGIPAENNGHAGGVTNSELLFIHTNGSPAHNIPPRPTIEPALQDPATRDKIVALMKQGMVAALRGDRAAAEDFYHKAGIIGENAAKEQFGSSELAPNAPKTIRRKGSSAPLIDTGALRSSITHVIRKKGW